MNTRVPLFPHDKDLTKSNRKDYVSMPCELQKKNGVNIWGFAPPLKFTMGSSFGAMKLIRISPTYIEEDQTSVVRNMLKKKSIWLRICLYIWRLRFMQLLLISILMAKIIDLKFTTTKNLLKRVFFKIDYFSCKFHGKLENCSKYSNIEVKILNFEIELTLHK